MQRAKGRGPRLPHCPNCPYNFGYYDTQERLEWHRKIYHPFNETWTDKQVKRGDLAIVECRFWYKPDPYGWFKEYSAQKHI